MGLRQEAEALFFGTGVQELYPHWQSEYSPSFRFQRHGEWPPGEAPDAWAYKIRITDPLNSERPMDRIITYSILYSAAEMITEEKVDTEKPFHSVDAETDRACSMWVFSDDLGMFDPHTLDQVLQVAVFGGLLHPHFEPRNRG
jgi:hypothetical protein